MAGGNPGRRGETLRRGGLVIYTLEVHNLESKAMELEWAGSKLREGVEKLEAYVKTVQEKVESDENLRHRLPHPSTIVRRIRTQGYSYGVVGDDGEGYPISYHFRAWGGDRDGQTIKALSLHQPWATAVARGSKRFETRSWKTSYKGPLAIHASKRCVKKELARYRQCWNLCGAVGVTTDDQSPLWDLLPFGAIIAVVQLRGCVPTERLNTYDLDTFRGVEPYPWTERQLGDFSPGRWAWCFGSVLPIDPVPYQGQQGIFDVPKNILR